MRDIDTKTVVESLIYHSQNKSHIRNALRLGRVINNKRMWHSKRHMHLDSYFSTFNAPDIIITINLVVTVFIISKSSKAKISNVVKIEGPDSYVSEMSKSKLLSEINKSLNIKDFMPDSNLKQIIWIPFSNGRSETVLSDDVDNDVMGIAGNKDIDVGRYIDAIIFTEHINKEWSINPDTSIPNPDSVMRTNQKEIVKNLLKEV